MRAFRIIQISDTHLSAERPWFVPNFEAMAAIVEARRPDLVINTGDISPDGVTRDAELVFSRGCHDALNVPFRFIAGNHDLGAKISDSRRHRQPCGRHLPDRSAEDAAAFHEEVFALCRRAGFTPRVGDGVADV